MVTIKKKKKKKKNYRPARAPQGGMLLSLRITDLEGHIGKLGIWVGRI